MQKQKWRDRAGLCEKNKNALLVLVPRHPERFDSVAALVQQHGFQLARRSLSETCTPEIAVYLGDTIYVLSHRPARILHQVDVPAFPVRDIALKSAPEFRAIEKKLLDLIYAPTK